MIHFKRSFRCDNRFSGSFPNVSSQRRRGHHLHQRDENEFGRFAKRRHFPELVQLEESDQEADEQEVGQLHHPASQLAQHANGKSGKTVMALVRSSVARLGDLLDFGQFFKAFGNNYFA